MTKDQYKKNYKKYINNTKFDDFMNSSDNTIDSATNNTIWNIDHGHYTTGMSTDSSVIQPLTSGGTFGQSINMPVTTGTYSYESLATRTPGTEEWPIMPDTLGLVYVEGDEIKIRMADGKTVVIGCLDDKDDFVPIEVIAAKKKLTD